MVAAGPQDWEHFVHGDRQFTDSLASECENAEITY